MLAPKRLVVGAAVEVVALDVPAEDAAAPPNSDDVAVAVVAGCELAVEAKLLNNPPPAVAVVAAGCADELAPPSEKPANGVEAGAFDVAVVEG